MNHASDPRLRLEGVLKSFFGVRVLDGVSFSAFAGEVLGLVGENGSGKSTTMNLIAGVLTCDDGRMSLDGCPHTPANRHEAEAAGIAFIQQELSIFPNLTVAENLLLGRTPRLVPGLPLISRRERRDRARKFLAAVGLHVEPDVRASSLSSGERQLLEIARALATDARVMIFDEPTTSLTARETERLLGLIAQIKSRGVAVIFISHNLEDVLRLSDRLVVMRDGHVTLSEARAGMTAERLILAMVGRSIDTLFPTRPLSPSVRLDTPPLLDVSGVGEPGIVEDINFRVAAGEIVGLSGLMGSGRSELARIVFGLDPHRAGRITLSDRALRPRDLRSRLDGGMAFLTEDRRFEGLMMDATVAENLTLAALPRFTGRGGRLHLAALQHESTDAVTRLHVRSGAIATACVRTLSGGNQQKVILGRWLLRQPRLFILDEPTRGVDVGAKEEIYRLLMQMAAEGMAILVVSSEIEELIGLSDRILVMRRGRIAAEFNRPEFDRHAILAAAFGQGRAA